MHHKTPALMSSGANNPPPPPPDTLLPPPPPPPPPPKSNTNNVDQRKQPHNRSRTHGSRFKAQKADTQGGAASKVTTVHPPPYPNSPREGVTGGGGVGRVTSPPPPWTPQHTPNSQQKETANLGATGARKVFGPLMSGDGCLYPQAQ